MREEGGVGVRGGGVGCEGGGGGGGRGLNTIVAKSSKCIETLVETQNIF